MATRTLTINETEITVAKEDGEVTLHHVFTEGNQPHDAAKYTHYVEYVLARLAAKLPEKFDRSRITFVIDAPVRMTYGWNKSGFKVDYVTPTKEKPAPSEAQIKGAKAVLDAVALDADAFMPVTVAAALLVLERA